MLRTLTFLFFICIKTLSGQITIDSVYYKVPYISTKKAKRAKYVLVTERINDSITKKCFSEIKTNRKVWTETYLNEAPYGIWEKFDNQGKPTKQLNYNFKVEYGLNIDRDKKLLADTEIIETNPSEENRKTINTHIKNTFRYPSSAVIEMTTGTVVFMLTVDTLGKIGNIRILRSIDPIIDAEAYRIAKSIPTLQPQTKNGIVTRALYKIPITFRIQ